MRMGCHHTDDAPLAHYRDWDPRVVVRLAARARGGHSHLSLSVSATTSPMRYSSIMSWTREGAADRKSLGGVPARALHDRLHPARVFVDEIG